MGSPQYGRQMQVGEAKIAFFDQWRSLWLSCLTAKIFCPFAMMVRIYDSALAEEYAMSSTTLVVVEIGRSQLRSSWHRQDWLYESLLMTPTELHASCEINESTEMMHVQNYAGSGIKRGRCWKCLLRLTCTTVGLHFNWYRASHRSLGNSGGPCSSSVKWCKVHYTASVAALHDVLLLLAQVCMKISCIYSRRCKWWWRWRLQQLMLSAKAVLTCPEFAGIHTSSPVSALPCVTHGSCCTCTCKML